MNHANRLLRRMLHETGTDTFHAMRLLSNMLDCKRKYLPDSALQPMEDAHTYELGLRLLAEQARSLPFRSAVQLYRTEMDAGKRRRTVCERRQIFRRLLAQVPEWADAPLSDWDAGRCRTALVEGFPTARGRNKAAGQLRGLFRYAEAQGWCRENPMRALRPERVDEREIALLSLPQMARLLQVSASWGYTVCAPAVGLMLWAGIRPAEVARLHWGDVDLTEGLVYIPAMHSKTGGPRQVTLQPVLQRWLRRFCPAGLTSETSLTPPCWARRWRELRCESGLQPWQNDTLRHCFASYHLKHFGSLERLQLEMGHSSTQLLRTRYLNMRGLTAAAAADFWAGRFGAFRV